MSKSINDPSVGPEQEIRSAVEAVIRQFVAENPDTDLVLEGYVAYVVIRDPETNEIEISTSYTEHPVAIMREAKRLHAESRRKLVTQTGKPASSAKKEPAQRFYVVKAQTRQDALAKIKAICTECVKKSFAGVQWTNKQGQTIKWSWKDVESQMNKRGNT
jgi:hypothetical protein